ncbi:transglycosylase SLT domain-containing protein [Antarcticibacterium sp. 1MA-6-2]|uniref:lytic transglycosylase domain-containing protein n=1 Tax=Antarcticibacterium sp. 1MA-6-2 TaxID=2908210 RepID=UPI001F309B3A|nr:lytic transglycosylase domain-containing protein [Antarcticibacterium sp. 1MA-6-2]UJH91981.1 transglycosylase SLT domain-containing protein [Antarcticibacterium sp. 1MA-6-2]
MKLLKIMLMSIGLITICALSIQAVQQTPAAKSTTEKIQERDEEGKVTKDYNIYALPMPDDLNFAGEPVPLDNPDIYERMDKELLVNTYWQSNALLLMKRANKYFPVIEPILKEKGVPDDLKYIAVIESSLTQAVSPARATGFWQIMEGTGKDYKLEINSNVDERYHIEKATRVAADYLKKSKEKFGSWTLAAAAYNAGNAGISRQLERQDVNDYYDLLLGEETGRYVFRILALKEIMKDPYKYGFHYEEKDLYKHIPTYTVEISSPVTDFAGFAKEHGINYKILKLHNPWLREAHLDNNSGKKYKIEIPQKGYYNVGM